MELDAESQLFVTFGQFAPTKGPFGLATLPEIFSRKMDEVIKEFGFCRVRTCASK